MTETQFVRNHRGIDQGKDPAKELLEGMYRRIKARAAVTLWSVAPSPHFRCLRGGPMYSPTRRLAKLETRRRYKTSTFANVFFFISSVLLVFLMAFCFAGVRDPHG